MIDVNANLSRWPFRRLPLDETPRLVQAYERSGIAQAWVSSLDGLLHKDISSVNARLVEECRRSGTGRLVPFGSINPTLPDWPEDLRRCDEVHHMPGIRLHPHYHGYGLDDERVKRLFAEAERRRLIVQIALKMEDERTQHPQMRVPTVDVAPLQPLLAHHPGLPVVLLNALRDLRGEVPGRLAESGSVYFDIGMLEGVGGVARLLENVPLERVLLGTHAPLFVIESALLKLRESELGEFRTRAVSRSNAERLLRWSRHAARWPASSTNAP